MKKIITFLLSGLIIPLISAQPSSQPIELCHSDEDIYYFTHLKSIKFNGAEKQFEYEKHQLTESKFNCNGTSINSSEISELAIEWCNFNKIPKEIFQIFGNLKKLTIKSESIESITKEDLLGANKLEYIGIYGNGIR